MSKQISCSVQWFLPAFMLLLFAQTALCQVEPTVNNVLESLNHAVKQDDNAAYRAARSVALELKDREFYALLEALAEAETWQALAVKGGLRVRRENPDLAVKFDRQLDWLKNTPTLARSGAHKFQSWKFLQEFDTSEGDWLRYEAVLTEKAELPPDASGLGYQLPGWIEFRRFVLRGGERHAEDMRFRIMMLRDMPEWIRYVQVLGGLPSSIRRSPHSVDMYVPELVEHYKRIRQAGGDLQLYITMYITNSIFFSLMDAIAEADTDIALAALREIREFEQTTGEEIDQSRVAQSQARLQEVEELREQALHEGREEDAQKLAQERQQLQLARHLRDIGPSVRRRLDEHIEKIEKHREAAELP